MRVGLVQGRMRLVARGLFALMGIVLIRVVEIVVVERDFLVAIAHKQQRREITLPPERGPIVDRDGVALALTKPSSSISFDPLAAQLRPSDIETLARILDVSPETVARRASSGSRFAWLRRNVSAHQADQVAGLGIAGVVVQPSRVRVYPAGTVAGQVLGFANIDGKGLEGLEREYDDFLKGTAETVAVERDARGGYQLTADVWEPKARQGARVELTIDSNLQRIVDDELAAAVAEQRAAAGFAMVMDPNTGEILAISNVPLFDPNAIGAAPLEAHRNRAASFRFEPGSTFKSIVAAAAIEAGVVWPDKRIFCENGSYAIGTRVIHDHDPYATLSFADVIKFSSNIGAAKVAEMLGVERFAKSVDAFGFGHLTGIDLPSEVKGAVRPSNQLRRINLVTSSYGHGISVTPIQLVRAYAALANGGRLMRPYIVRRVVSPYGEVLSERKPMVVGLPVSGRTTEVVTDMLSEVVTGGTGTLAAIDGVPVAGKTGTSRKLDLKTGVYSRRDYISSFIGYFPAAAPQFVMLVAIDQPRAAIYGGVVAGPVFRNVGEYLADRHGLRVPKARPPQGTGQDVGVEMVNWSTLSAEGMPSYLGLPLRDALRQATRAGWEVVTTGSGFVAAQDPPAGATTGQGRVLRLELRSTLG